MGNWARLAISVLAGATLAAVSFAFPYSPLIYFFAPGFWLGDSLPDRLVNALGGHLFPVFASVVVWALLIFGVWLTTRSRLTSVRNRS